MMLPSGVTDTR